MPDLPVYNSNKNIDPQLQEPLRDEAVQPFKDNAAIIETAQKIDDQWNAANDTMQYTEAKAKHGIQIADVQNRAASDPNFKNSPQYYKELQKITQQATVGIENSQVAERANAEFQYDAGIASLKMQNDFRQKQMAFNLVNVKTSVDTLLQSKLAAATPAEAQNYQTQMDTLIQANIASGVLSPKEAETLVSNSQKTAVEYQIAADPSTQEQDSHVLAELKDPKGQYSFLAPSVRLDLVQEAQRRIFQNNQTYKREVDQSQTVRNNDFIQKMAEGTANFQDVNNEMKIPEEQGGMKRSVLLQYQKYLQSGVDKTLNEYLREGGKNDPTKRAQLAKQYNELIESYMDDNSDKWKAKEMLAKGLKDGVLDADELKILNPLKDGLKDIQFNKDTSPIATAIKTVKGWMGNNNAPSDQIALRLKQMMNSLGAGDTVEVAQSKVMAAEMLSHFPEHQQYPKEGKRFMDKKTGRAYVVYPDGKWAWVQGKNPEGTTK